MCACAFVSCAGLTGAQQLRRSVTRGVRQCPVMDRSGPQLQRCSALSKEQLRWHSVLACSGAQPLRSSRSGSRPLRSSTGPVLGSSGHWLFWRSLPLWRTHRPVPVLGVFSVLDGPGSRSLLFSPCPALGNSTLGLFYLGPSTFGSPGAPSLGYSSASPVQRSTAQVLCGFSTACQLWCSACLF